MEKYRKTVLAALLVSETSHIFCCVLPTVFSIVSVLSGIGIISTLPTGWVHVHEILHHWEVPMITISGIILVMGWGACIITPSIWGRTSNTSIVATVIAGRKPRRKIKFIRF
jgi:hypothetical protein